MVSGKLYILLFALIFIFPLPTIVFEPIGLIVSFNGLLPEGVISQLPSQLSYSIFQKFTLSDVNEIITYVFVFGLYIFMLFDPVNQYKSLEPVTNWVLSLYPTTSLIYSFLKKLRGFIYGDNSFKSSMAFCAVVAAVFAFVIAVSAFEIAVFAFDIAVLAFVIAVFALLATLFM